MELEFTRRELIDAFVPAFAHEGESVASMETSWGHWLRSLAYLGAISFEVCDEWIEVGCPKAAILSGLAQAYHDYPYRPEDWDMLEEPLDEDGWR